MIRPTRRAALLFAGLLPVPWIALSYRAELWPRAFDCAVLALAAIALDAVLARPRRRVQIEVDVPDAAFIGECVEAAVTLRTGGERATRYELALDVSGDAEPQTAAVTALMVVAAAREVVRIVPRRRGLILIESVWVRWRGPMGLVEETRRFRVGRKVGVLPNTYARRGEELSLYFRDALYGAKVQRGRGEGAEFEALRDFAPGLDSRFIDWKHSARHRELLAREFRVERNHPVVLALDTGYLMREPVDGTPRLDHSISSGLLLARVALGAGDLVGSYSFDSRPRQYLPPARGMHTFRRLQQASAELAYTSDETNFTLGIAELRMRLRRRSLIVLFTDFVDTVTAELLVENVRRLATRHLLIFVAIRDRLLTEIFETVPQDTRQMARAVLADDFRRDRGIVLEKLERLGIHCIDLPPAGIATALLNRYLVIKQRGLL